LAHAFVANLFGYRVNQIYIDLFYGAAEVDLNNCPERDIIPIVAAGPLSNLFLFGLTMVTISSFPGVEFLVNLAAVNLILFIFNIIPIYPMDGGRLFRAFLMMKMPSNRWKAKRISDWTSLVFCFLLLTYSISTSAWIMVIFSLLFIYYTLKELNYLK
jgi:stage IV sporulation protein FB